VLAGAVAVHDVELNVPVAGRLEGNLAVAAVEGGLSATTTEHGEDRDGSEPEPHRAHMYARAPAAIQMGATTANVLAQLQ